MEITTYLTTALARCNTQRQALTDEASILEALISQQSDEPADPSIENLAGTDAPAENPLPRLQDLVAQFPVGQYHPLGSWVQPLTHLDTDAINTIMMHVPAPRIEEAIISFDMTTAAQYGVDDSLVPDVLMPVQTPRQDPLPPEANKFLTHARKVLGAPLVSLICAARPYPQNLKDLQVMARAETTNHG